MSVFSFSDRYFAFLERRSIGDRWLFMTGVILAVTGLFVALIQFNQAKVVATPVAGGTLTEGIIGTPRFINPVLAITRADQDVVSLVYNGLMKLTADGTLEPDIAKTITRSDDGRQYTVTLRDNVFFHDGKRLTSQDVVFTINLVQDPNLKSPLLSDWDGVVTEAVDEQTLTITLREPYAPFIENFTLGILPAHIWSSIPIEQIPFSQHNTEPVGSGLYHVDSVTRNPAGLIEAYSLTASTYAQIIPNLETINLRFFTNEAELVQALEEKTITATQSLHPRDAGIDDLIVEEEPMSRTFGVFYNQNRSPVVRDTSVRQALAAVVNKEDLIDTVLGGYGVPTSYPIPDTFIATSTPLDVQSSSTMSRTQQAEQILIDGGWEQADDDSWSKEIDEKTVNLKITLQTINTATFEATAQYLQNAWESIGIAVEVEQFEQADFIQSVVRPRNFTVLLFGSDIGRSLDVYPFWHSSQKDDPGLNITRYTNIEADALLEDIRETDEVEEREAAAVAFFDILRREQPALFLYAPTLTYVHHPELHIPNPVARITAPHERFATIANWNVTTEHLWPLFTND